MMMEVATLAPKADKLSQWIARFASPFVKMSIEIECARAAAYSPLYDTIVEVYQHSVLKENLSKEQFLIEQAKHSHESVFVDMGQ